MRTTDVGAASSVPAYKHITRGGLGTATMLSYEDDPTTSCLGALRPPQGLTEWRNPKSADGVELCKFFMDNRKTCDAGDACVRSHQPRQLRSTCPSWSRYGVCERGSTCWFPHPVLDPEPADVDLALLSYVSFARRVVERCRELFGADCVVGSSRADLTKNSVCTVFIRCGGATRGLRTLAECDDAAHLLGNLRRLLVLRDDGAKGSLSADDVTETFSTNAPAGETHEDLRGVLRDVLRERLAVASRAYARDSSLRGGGGDRRMKLRVRGFPKQTEACAVDAATTATESCDEGTVVLSPGDATHCLDVVTSRGRVYVALWSTGDVLAEEPGVDGDVGGLGAAGIPLPARGEATTRDLVHACERVQEMRHARPPPCRAYYKIEEAFARSGVRVQKGWKCVDVGASPGGWTSYLSARLSGGERGRVWAVDPAALSGLDPIPDNVTHLRMKAEECEGALLADAFDRGLVDGSRVGVGIVDLVVCDANAAPMKVASMLSAMSRLMKPGGWLVTTFKNFCRGAAEWEREVCAGAAALARAGFERPRVYHLFSNCPQEKTLVARWKARSRNLVNELAGLDSDVLALQEVDQYEEFWQPWLVERGYDGVYKCRTQLTKSKRDGCGLFFKRDKFELLARRDIEYNDIAWGRPVGYVHPEGSPEPTEAPVDADGGANKYIRDCVGVLALLRSKTATDGYVMVASTHLYWDPAHADVKLAQARRLLGEVELFLASNSPIGSVPVVTAGDFNSVPGSEVHSAMLGGFGGRRLRSAYAAAIGEGLVRGADGGSDSSVAVGKHGEPEHTNVTPGFTDCIDYVFVDENVAVRSAMPLPGRDEVATGLPDATRGSDHLPLTVDLELWSR